MAKKKTFATWPFRIRGLYIVLGASLMVNVVAISFVAYFNSRQADLSLVKTAIDHACQRDYDYLKADQAKHSDASAVLFSEQLCSRDAITGQTIPGEITAGHYMTNR